MSGITWNSRFFASTRGKIVTLLRRASRTVDELAQALDLTDNAVRAHLATLERDGFVQQRGERRGSGKPSDSGSYENGSSFKVVPMEKKTQTSLMHRKRLGEREGLANETS